MLQICNVLCTSHCGCIYNVPPLMGQVLGKVFLTSRENELTIDGDFRTSGLFLVPRLFTHLVWVTGLPDPVD